MLQSQSSASCTSHARNVFVSGDFLRILLGDSSPCKTTRWWFQIFFPNAFREGFPFIVGGLRVGHGRVASCLSWMRIL